MVLPDEGSKKQRDGSFTVCMVLGVLLGLGNIASQLSDFPNRNGEAIFAYILGAVLGMPVYGIILFAIWKGVRKISRAFNKRAS